MKWIFCDPWLWFDLIWQISLEILGILNILILWNSLMFCLKNPFLLMTNWVGFCEFLFYVYDLLNEIMNLNWIEFMFVCRITFTPTVRHCSMVTVIGLCLRVKLKHYFPAHYKVCFFDLFASQVIII